MQKLQSKLRNLRWLDRAIILCAPALVVNFIDFGIIAYLREQGPLASVLIVLFTIILTLVGIVLFIHFTGVAYSFLQKARASSQHRAERVLAGLGIGILCILLAVIVLINVSRIGFLTGGDAILMTIEIPLVGFLAWDRVRPQQQSGS
jgi:hypothetical protein